MLFLLALVGIIIVCWLRMVTVKGAGRWFFICTVAFLKRSFPFWLVRIHGCPLRIW